MEAIGHAHGLILMKPVGGSSLNLSLLILDHHVTNNSKLLCFRGSQYTAALPYNHFWVVILFTDFAGLKKSRCSEMFIFNKNFIVLKVSIRVSEYIVDIFVCNIIGNLCIDDLFLLSVMFEHLIEECVHTITLLQGENILLLRSMHVVLIVILLFFCSNCLS